MNIFRYSFDPFKTYKYIRIFVRLILHPMIIFKYSFVGKNNICYTLNQREAEISEMITPSDPSGPLYSVMDKNICILATITIPVECFGVRGVGGLVGLVFKFGTVFGSLVGIGVGRKGWCVFSDHYNSLLVVVWFVGWVGLHLCLLSSISLVVW